MKRILATGLAACLVAATLTATGGAAIARDRHWKPSPSHHYQHATPSPAPFLFGTFFGLALGQAFSPPPPPPPVYYSGLTSAHIATCRQWYGVWYNPATDLWTDSLGGVHRCTAPY